MKNFITAICIFSFLGTFAQTNYSQQKVRRGYSIFSPMVNTIGEITINENEVSFKTKIEKNSKHNFTLKSNEIRKVQRSFLLIFPNVIYITGPNNERYKIGTYRRKKIIDAIRSNMK